MENISHSVVGLASAYLITQNLSTEPTPQDSAKRQRLMLLGGLISSNLPDADLILTKLYPAPLGYLLEHRGFTHTLGWLLPQALFTMALLWLLYPAGRRLLHTSARARWGLGLTCMVGLGLHFLMDYLNSYGLHPFYPFDTHWYYGDSLFIVEPAFWIVLGIPLALILLPGGLRWLPPILLLLAPICWAFYGYLTWQSVILLLALYAISMASPLTLSSGRHSMSLAFIIVICWVLTQMWVSLQLRQHLDRLLTAQNSQERLLDITLTPFPANPWCWQAYTVASNESIGQYRLQHYVLSAAPGWLPVRQCPARLYQAQKPIITTPGYLLLSSESFSLARLRQLAHDNCHFMNWMRFARVPAIEQQFARDARFDNKTRDFSALSFAAFKQRACEEHVPPWTPPRQDLLLAPAKN